MTEGITPEGARHARTSEPVFASAFADVADQLAYFDKVFGLTPTFSPTDQIWLWKELLSLAALVAAATRLRQDAYAAVLAGGGGVIVILVLRVLAHQGFAMVVLAMAAVHWRKLAA